MSEHLNTAVITTIQHKIPVSIVHKEKNLWEVTSTDRLQMSGHSMWKLCNQLYELKRQSMFEFQIEDGHLYIWGKD